MAPQSRVMRIIAGIFGFLFFGTNCLFAYSTESNLWAERRRAREQRSSPTLLASLPVGASSGNLYSQIPPPQKLGPSLSRTVARSVPKSFLKDHAALLAALSPAHGTIRKVSLSPKPSTFSPIVIHIQDVHQNLEAQRNIGHLVGSLLNTHQAGLIALEGTWGDIKLQPFRDFANRKAVELSADYLLKENKISGPIHSALIGTGPLPPVIGIDDPAHYNANVDAYRQSAPHLEELKKELAAHKAILEQEKKRVFSSELKTLDEAVESYRSGRSSMGDYVQSLSNPSFHLAVPASVQTFQKTISLERTIDFKQVENERASLINRLVEKMSRPEMDELTAQSVAYRSGEVSYANFYNYLQGVCSKAGVSLQSFPAMREYIQYVLLADGITAETLFDDLMSLERMAYSKLAKTPEAMAAVKKARSAYLTGKLVDFSLTPEEWKEYRSLSITDKSLSSFENFYREADARDHAMAENLLNAIQTGKSLQVSILVTGGYHSPGLTAQLTQAGATVISVVPKIEKIETTQGSTYLSVFTQEKTPLDKLFIGEKLFLAQDPISKPTRQITAPTLAVLTALLLGQVLGNVDLNAVLNSLGGVGILSDLARSGTETVSATIAVGGAFFMARVSKNNSGGVSVFITPKAMKEDFVDRLKIYLKRLFLSFAVSLSVVGNAFSAQNELDSSIIVEQILSYGWMVAILMVIIGIFSLGFKKVMKDKRKTAEFELTEPQSIVGRISHPYFGEVVHDPDGVQWNEYGGGSENYVMGPYLIESFDPNRIITSPNKSASDIALLMRPRNTEMERFHNLEALEEIGPTVAEPIAVNVNPDIGLQKRIKELIDQRIIDSNKFVILSHGHFVAGAVALRNATRNKQYLFDVAVYYPRNNWGKGSSQAMNSMAFQFCLWGDKFFAGNGERSSWAGGMAIVLDGHRGRFDRNKLISSDYKGGGLTANINPEELFGTPQEFMEFMSSKGMKEIVIITEDFVKKGGDNTPLPLEILKNGGFGEANSDLYPYLKELEDKVKITVVSGDVRPPVSVGNWDKENKDFSSPLGRLDAGLPAPGPAESMMRERGGGPGQLSSGIHHERGYYSSLISKHDKEIRFVFNLNDGKIELFDLKGNPLKPSAYENGINEFIREIASADAQTLGAEVYSEIRTNDVLRRVFFGNGRSDKAVFRKSGNEGDTGRATSLWGVKSIEFLFGKRVGIERVGNIYKALAPVIGIGFALVATATAWGGLVFLDGSALAGIVAPLVGAVFGMIFLASHYLLPESWLPESHSREDISFPKVLTMTILYTASITLTLWGIFGVEILGMNSTQMGALSRLFWPVALLVHGFFDGWVGSVKQLPNYLKAPQKFFGLKKAIISVAMVLSTVFPNLALSQTVQGIPTSPPSMMDKESETALPSVSEKENKRVYDLERAVLEGPEDAALIAIQELENLSVSLTPGSTDSDVFLGLLALENLADHRFHYFLKLERNSNWVSSLLANEKTTSSLYAGILVNALANHAPYLLDEKLVNSIVRRIGYIGDKPLLLFESIGHGQIRFAPYEMLFLTLLEITSVRKDLKAANPIAEFIDQANGEDHNLFVRPWPVKILESPSFQESSKGISLRLKLSAANTINLHLYRNGIRSAITDADIKLGIATYNTQLKELAKIFPFSPERDLIAVINNEPTLYNNPGYHQEMFKFFGREDARIYWGGRDSKSDVLKMLASLHRPTTIMFSVHSSVERIALEGFGSALKDISFDELRAALGSVPYDTLKNLVIIFNGCDAANGVLRLMTQLKKMGVPESYLPTIITSAGLNSLVVGKFKGERMDLLGGYKLYAKQNKPKGYKTSLLDVFDIMRLFGGPNFPVVFIPTRTPGNLRQENDRGLTPPQLPLHEKIFMLGGLYLEPVGDTHHELSNLVDNGRATSLWGVRFAEVLFGKQFVNEKVGNVYKALAPAIGTGLALGFTALAWGGLVVLDGSSVAGVVAPLVGAVFGGIFLASHYLLPESWLPKSHSRKDISFPKVLTMTILYAASITLSLWGIFDIEMLGLNTNQISALSFLIWPVALLSHGFFDGWYGSVKNLFDYLITSQKLLASPLAKGVVVFVLLTPFLFLGDPALSNPFALDGSASGVTGFLPFLLGSIKNHSGVGFEPDPFGQVTEVAKVMDVGSYPRGKWRMPKAREFPGATFRLIMNTPVFDTEGKSRVDFKRVENTLSLDGKDVPFTSTTLNEVRGEPPHVDPSDVLALLPNGNLGMNDWFVGFANGTFYHTSREEWETRTYEMLVQPVEGRPRVQTLRFNLVNGKWNAYDATTSYDVTNAISFAVYGQRIVKEGVNNVENLAEQFDDLRHLLRIPMFDFPGNPQFHFGFNDGSGELYHDRQKVTAALKGEPVTLSLQPLEDHHITVAERDKVFTTWGYIRRPDTTPLKDLKPGDYVASEKGKSLTMRFLPGIHPHSFFGLTQSGELMAGLVPGQTHHEGTSVHELANHLVADKTQDVFLWANGKDAKVLGSSLSGESDNARAGFLAAIAIQSLAPSGSNDASNVVDNLDARSTDLGVDKFMDGKARLTVEDESRRAKKGEGMLLAESSIDDGKGDIVLFVDFRSVETTKARQDLAAFVHGKPNARIITDAENLTLPGVAANRILLRPEVFSPLRTPEGIPLGLVQVSLAGLEDDLFEISKAGNGLQFMQTAVIQLKSEGVSEDRQDVLHAIERSWVLNALFQLSVPSRSLDWHGIIKTLTVIARNA